MPSTYTKNLVIEKPATGEQAGIWGTTANQSYDFIDMGIDGSASVSLSSPSYPLATDPRAESVGRNKVIVFTGALSNEGNVSITPNNAKKIYYVLNHTSNGFGLTFGQGGGNKFHLLNGKSAIIYSDGLGTAASVYGVLDDFQVNSLLVVSNLIIQGQINWGGASAVIDKPATFSGLATFNAGATFAAGPVTINLGADQPNDLYYRSGIGSLARLAISGTPGQVLTAGVGGLSWASPAGASIGMTVTSGAGNQILYVDTGQHMAQNAQLQFVPNVGLGSGMTPNRALSVGTGLSNSAVIQIDSPLQAGSNQPFGRALMFTTSNAPRWSMSLSTEAELGPGGAGGGVSGGNFALGSWNDAQTQNPYVFVALRNGRCSFGNVYADLDAHLTVRNTSGSSYLQKWQKPDGTTVASIDSNGNFIAASVPGGGGGGGLALNGMNRLAINGVVAGFPLSTLHIGPDAGGNTNGPNPAIVLEGTSAFGNNISGNAIRLYFRNSPMKIVIQYSVGATAYWAYMPLAADGTDAPYVWHITNNAQ